jgi:hypothetical protein
MRGCATEIPTDDIQGDVTVQCFDVSPERLSPNDRVRLVLQEVHSA